MVEAMVFGYSGLEGLEIGREKGWQKNKKEENILLSGQGLLTLFALFKFYNHMFTEAKHYKNIWCGHHTT